MILDGANEWDYFGYGRGEELYGLGWSMDGLRRVGNDQKTKTHVRSRCGGIGTVRAAIPQGFRYMYGWLRSEGRRFDLLFAFLYFFIGLAGYSRAGIRCI